MSRSRAASRSGMNVTTTEKILLGLASRCVASLPIGVFVGRWMHRFGARPTRRNIEDTR